MSMSLKRQYDILVRKLKKEHEEALKGMTKGIIVRNGKRIRMSQHIKAQPLRSEKL